MLQKSIPLFISQVILHSGLANRADLIGLHSFIKIAGRMVTGTTCECFSFRPYHFQKNRIDLSTNLVHFRVVALKNKLGYTEVDKLFSSAESPWLTRANMNVLTYCISTEVFKQLLDYFKLPVCSLTYISELCPSHCVALYTHQHANLLQARAPRNMREV